ncbi:MAG: hypothetical protein ACFBWO_08815 [Paracoccaceae bacterium]
MNATPGGAPGSPETRAFFRDGFVVLDRDPRLEAWVEAVRPLARRLAEAARTSGAGVRCGSTWFAGVDALGNDAAGAVATEGVPPLDARALDLARALAGVPVGALDIGQLSVVWPGYPAAPDGNESEAAFRYRVKRDAAHVDGVQRDAARRRTLSEAHAFLLGIPLETMPPEAAPFVVWRGSHEVMRRALARRLAGVAVAGWPREDVTEAYQAARRTAFETCERVTIAASPGAAYVVHRLALHGVAPWPSTDALTARPRAVVYFRPEPDGARDLARWLGAP